MKPTPEMIEAACAAVILGEDEDGNPVHLQPSEAEAALSAALSVPAAAVVGEPSKAYEAGYNDARADALRELRYAMRDIAEGETVKTRLQQCYDDIETKEMPEDTRGKG